MPNKLKKIVEEEADEPLFWFEFVADSELIHQPDKAVPAGRKLLKNLIKEANELVSIFTAALQTSKIIVIRKSEILSRLVRFRITP